MKKILFLPVFFSVLGYSQVGINTTTPVPSAVLDITSQNKGVLFPRVSLQSITDITTILNPAEGLFVWNTNANLVQGKGLYYFLDGTWIKIPKQFNPTGKVYDFVEFKQTSSNLVMTSTLQEITQLSTTYTAPSDGNIFLNYIVYSTMGNNTNPKVSNTYCEVQVTDTTTSIVQKGTILISPVLVVSNQGSNAAASPSLIPVDIVKGHTYTIKLFAKEAYLDSSYVVRVGTVTYSGNSANSSLVINSLLNL
ncbi:hypothetical protein [Chryseobacterium jejuense]|uniref:Uncharacterized protein n=1 Tax=Chryseobacterium jejuense TaxID=445960 RepID=A0A2X2VDX6_CHRJE|nr:hypothetical protein [Chryseobacterium jejuense]SQB27226.1 Uncharacterised protein [Chryseobacterium jejuense]